MEILNEKENKLLKRKEYLIYVKYESATPSKEQMQELISKFLNVNKDNIEIHKIISEIGKCAGKVWARVWEDKTFSYGKPKKEESKEEAATEEKTSEEASQEQQKSEETKEGE